jgi:hypothetical protein
MLRSIFRLLCVDPYKEPAFLIPHYEDEKGLPGNVLLSRDPAVQVPSALEGLTVVFEMGTRGTPPPSSPDRLRKSPNLRGVLLLKGTCPFKTELERNTVPPCLRRLWTLLAR